MTQIRRSLLCFAAGVASLGAACAPAATGQAGQTSLTCSSEDVALSREKADVALAAIPAAGGDCRVVAIEGAPFAVTHLQDANLQQTIGRGRLVAFADGDHPEKEYEGTVLATLVGKQPTGETLGNHHMMFPEGALRTQNDVISMSPTADKCVFNAKAKVYFHDGAGEFAGYSGQGVAEAQLNFCGAEGNAIVYGRLCKVEAK